MRLQKILKQNLYSYLIQKLETLKLIKEENSEYQVDSNIEFHPCPIFLIPNKNDKNINNDIEVLDYSDIIPIIRMQKDKLSQCFADSLLNWST